MAPTITALDCGWLRTQERTLSNQGSKDEQRFPVPSWLVQHAQGTVVFDVGLHPDLVDGPESLGPLSKRFTPELDLGGTVGHRLAEHDVDPHGELIVVLSHCHFDHAGGLCELPNARVIIQAEEWVAATGEDDVAYDKSLYQLGHDVLAIHGAHDLFGDGTARCGTRHADPFLEKLIRNSPALPARPLCGQLRGLATASESR